MILVAVDDFLFRSKIRTTGKQAGVELTFPRTPDEVLEQARAMKPSLAIFDLNSAKLEPIDTIARMKRDPELSSIHTLGFVSHVDAARIQAARERAPTRSWRDRPSPPNSPTSCWLTGRASPDPRRHPCRRAAHRGPHPSNAAPLLVLAECRLGGRCALEARDGPTDVLVQGPRRIQHRAADGRRTRRNPAASGNRVSRKSRPGTGVGSRMPAA